MDDQAGDRTRAAAVSNVAPGIGGFRVEGRFRGHEVTVTWSAGRLDCDDEDLRDALDEGLTGEGGLMRALNRALRTVRATLVQIDASPASARGALPVELLSPSMSDPHLSVILRGGAPTADILVAGDLDLVTGPRLRHAVPALVPTGSTAVALDVGHVDFCDAAGLHSLILLGRELREGGTPLSLRHPSASMRRILDLTDTRVEFATS